MKYIAVKIKPKSSFHLGEREKWSEGSIIYFPADTIFSALCHAHLLLYGEVDNFINEFIETEPPFLLSSAFPCTKDDYFFPLPKNKFMLLEDIDKLTKINREKHGASAGMDLKKIKKIQYVSLEGLNLLLAGATLIDLIIKSFDDPEIKTFPVVFEGSLREKEKRLEKLWSTENVPRIALNRLTSHPGENFFHFGLVHYGEESALFTVVKLIRPEWESKLKAMFYLLSHEGIGGDRTCGKGLFKKPEFNEINLPIIHEGDGVYCLSPYFPAPLERSGLAQGYYELEERKGYIFSPFGRSLRRRSVRVFREGSVFPRDTERRGSLIDLTPDAFKVHKVYRYALLFSLPCYVEAK